jgi:8-oxo-dGTP pyrophosphatase MutT (NUDIX family)
VGGFRHVNERVIHQGHITQFVEATFEAPDGSRFTRDILRHPGAVGVVAVDQDEVLMVRQYRPAIDEWLLEIPAGTRDQPGEEPRSTAVRELAEEVGATAASVVPLASYLVAPGVSDEVMHLFLATGLRLGRRSADGPEEEHMTVERIRLPDAPALIASGAIQDAKSIVGLLLAGSSARDGSFSLS